MRWFSAASEKKEKVPEHSAVLRVGMFGRREKGGKGRRGTRRCSSGINMGRKVLKSFLSAVLEKKKKRGEVVTLLAG